MKKYISLLIGIIMIAGAVFGGDYNCSAENYNFTIFNYPCTQYDIDLENVESYTGATWAGNSELDADFFFGYPLYPITGKVYLNKTENHSEVQNKTYTFYNITGNYTTNESCEIGNGSTKRNITWSLNGTQESAVVCFDDYSCVENGDKNCTMWWNQTFYWQTYWKDITSKFDYWGYHNQTERHWWYVKNVTFQPNTTKLTRWIYSLPMNASPIGKWDIIVKPSDETFQEAYNSGHYVHLDPWWNSSWGKGWNYNLTEESGTKRVNYPVHYNFTNLTFDSTDEIRIVNQSCSGSNGVEYPYKIVSNGSNWAAVTFLANVSASSTGQYCIYYNNSGASAPSYTWRLQLWLDMEDNASGSLETDKSGFGNDVYLIAGDPTWNATGGFNNSGGMEFDAVGDRLTIPYDDSLNYTNFGAVAETVWVKPAALTGVKIIQKTMAADRLILGTLDKSIVGEGTGYGFYYQKASGQTVASTTNLSVGTWSHAIGYYNDGANNLTMYYNGAIEDSETDMREMEDFTADHNLTISRSDAETYYGVIDEFMVWNRSLTDEEATSLAGASKFTFTLGSEESQASACSMSADYTQSAANSSCNGLYTNNYTWDTAGYNLVVNGSLIINGTAGVVDAGEGGNVTVDNGSFLIESGCTYNATNATTTLKNDSIANNGTFTHNQGTVVIDTDNGHIHLNQKGTTAFTFYNLNTTGTNGFYPYKNETIINSADFDTDFIINGATTITGGNSTQSATFNLQSGNTQGCWGGNSTLKASDSSYSLIITGADQTDLAQNTGYTFFFENVDFQIDLTTGGDGNTYQLDANSEFDNLTITNGDTFNANEQTANITGDLIVNGTFHGRNASQYHGSLAVQNSGVYNATSGTTTITSNDGTNCIQTATSGATLTANSGTFNITASSGKLADLSYATGRLYNLEIASSGTIESAESGAGMFYVDNDLTISLGTFDMSFGNDDQLNVTGDVDITGTLTGGTANAWMGSLTINSGGTYSATNGTTTITNETTGDLAIDYSGTLTANSGTFNITTPTNTRVDLDGTGNFYNLEISTASVVDWTGNSTIDNDLTISSGTFRSYLSGNSLTVTGDVDITGILAANTSLDCSFGSLTINSGGTYNATSGTTTITSEDSGTGFAFDCDGTLTANSGRFNFTTPSNTEADYLCTGNLYDLEIAMGGNNEFRVQETDTIDNDLTVTSGIFDLDYGDEGVTVTGDVSVTGTFDGNALGGIAASLGSLTINAGGEYIATSGTTTISGNFDNDGTFTHNDGTVVIDAVAAGTYAIIQASGTSEPTFYDLQVNGDSSWFTTIRNNITIVNNLTETDDTNDKIRISADTSNFDIFVTIGNSTQSGEISLGAQQLEFDSDTSGNDAYLYGANQLYPVIIDNDQHFDFGGSGTTVYIKWIDLQDSQTTGGAGATIILDADCEFDDFTVSSGDTLDLNGQRAEFSGLFYIDGTLSGADGALVYLDDLSFGTDKIDNEGTWVFKDSQTIALGSANNRLHTAFIDGNGTNTQTVVPFNATNLIIGANTFDTGNQDGTVYGNLTIATGGTLDAGSSTITVSGDWKSSGGLIGKSALDLNGSQFVNMTDVLNMNTSDFTLEAWIKTETTDSLATWGRHIVGKHKHGVMQAYAITINKDGNTGLITFKSSDDSAYLWDVDSNTTVNDGKWHHIVGVRDYSDTSTGIKIYIDGKLDAQGSQTQGNVYNTNNFVIGADSVNASNTQFNGTIARVSIWNESLTEAHIRELMFEDYDSLTNSTGLVSWWQFDEGTGTNVADNKDVNNGTASDSNVWASGGTFTYGTSTVNMTGNGTMYVPGGFNIYNLEVAQSSTTTTVDRIIGTADFEINNLLTVGAGTFTSDHNMDITGTASPVVDSASDLTIGNNILYYSGGADITSTTYYNLYPKTTTHNLAGDTIVNNLLYIYSNGVLISNGYNLTTEDITVTSGSTLNLTAGSKLIFEDTAGTGFTATSAGTLNSIGTSGNWATITSDTTPPTNYWIGDTNMTWNLAYTDIKYGTVFGTNETSTSLNYVNFSNMNTSDIKARDIILEFNNSNFNESNLNLSTSGNIISANHNDTANAYYVMTTNLNTSDITNIFGVSDNIWLISGNLFLNENYDAGNFTVEATTTANLTNSIFNMSDGNLSIDAAGTFAIGNYSNVSLHNITISGTPTFEQEGNLTVRWHINLTVTDASANGISASEVNVTDVNGAKVHEGTTNSSGYLALFNLTEYSENASGKVYSTQHNASANHTTYTTNSTTFNMTTESQPRNMDVNIILPALVTLTTPAIIPSTVYEDTTLNCSTDIDVNATIEFNWYKNPFGATGWTHLDDYDANVSCTIGTCYTNVSVPSPHILNDDYRCDARSSGGAWYNSTAVEVQKKGGTVGGGKGGSGSSIPCPPPYTSYADGYCIRNKIGINSIELNLSENWKIKIKNFGYSIANIELKPPEELEISPLKVQLKPNEETEFIVKSTTDTSFTAVLEIHKNGVQLANIPVIKEMELTEISGMLSMAGFPSNSSEFLGALVTEILSTRIFQVPLTLVIIGTIVLVTFVIALPATFIGELIHYGKKRRGRR